MQRRERKVLISELVRLRLFTVGCGLAAAGMLVTGARRWGDRDDVLLWLGLGTFVAAFTVIVGSAVFRARPLKALGTGAWVLLMGFAALAVLLGRDAVHVTGKGEGWVQALSVVLTVVLPLVGIGLMIERPKLRWEREAEANPEAGREQADR